MCYWKTEQNKIFFWDYFKFAKCSHKPFDWDHNANIFLQFLLIGFDHFLVVNREKKKERSKQRERKTQTKAKRKERDKQRKETRVENGTDIQWETRITRQIYNLFQELWNRSPILKGWYKGLWCQCCLADIQNNRTGSASGARIYSHHGSLRCKKIDFPMPRIRWKTSKPIEVEKTGEDFQKTLNERLKWRKNY